MNSPDYFQSPEEPTPSLYQRARSIVLHDVSGDYIRSEEWSSITNGAMGGAMVAATTGSLTGGIATTVGLWGLAYRRLRNMTQRWETLSVDDTTQDASAANGDDAPETPYDLTLSTV